MPSVFSGALLRDRCKAQNKRLEQLAVDTGLSWQHIYSLTRDLKQPSTRTLALLTEALGCEVGDLFADDDTEPVPQ